MMKKLIALLLTAVLMLSGCAGSQDTETTEATADSVINPTSDSSSTEHTTVPPSTEEVTQPPVLYRHPLNGQPVDSPIMTRPFAVVINNIYDAQPHHGISKADILYEYVVEGGGTITRCLAIFSDPLSAGPIGSVRSARTYNISIARSYKALFAHAGGSNLAKSVLSSRVVPDLDASYAGPEYFYRDQNRRNNGYAFEHTLFTTGEKLMAYAQSKGYDWMLKEPYDVGLQFSDKVELNGESAQLITMHFSGANGKGTLLNYDPKLDQYTMTQEFYHKHLLPEIDGNTKDAVTFRNVLVLRAVTTLHSDGQHMLAQLVGEGEGYFACGGKMVPIKWHRASEDSPFSYTMADGTPITLGVGHTYVGIVSTKSPVTFQ